MVNKSDPKARALLIQEVFETARCMFVISCMAAWPIRAHLAGEPTGLFWSLEEQGRSLPGYMAGFLVGIPAADAWLYLKHRLLHTKYLWVFHAHHHTFRNPTAFGGFAVGPLEALWTFAPIGLWAHAPHWIPVFAPSLILFAVLNCYLHCGFSFAWAERLLPALLLNSSCFHNVHHEKVCVHFGEISSFWDYVCGTADIYKGGLRAGYRWHHQRHANRAAEAQSKAA